jgi:hypothetical protein
VLTATVVMTAWLLATGLATNLVNDGNLQIQRSGSILTNLDPADACQDEKLPSAMAQPLGSQFSRALLSVIPKPAETPDWLCRADDSYQQSCVLVL